MVVTGEVSSVTAQTATLHGTLEHDSETSTDVRFEYGTSAGGPYSDVSPWQAGFSSGDTFDAELSGLLGGTRYYYRAQATNSGGAADGEERVLGRNRTACEFSAQATGETGAMVTWHLGEGADTTVVWRKQDSPPDGAGDGHLVYEGSVTSVDDTGLDPGSRYYYRAWSATDDSLLGTQVSDDSALDCAHTIGNDVWMVGDVNHDGRTDVADATIVFAFTMELEDLNANQLLAGDTTNDPDKHVDIADATHMFAYTMDPTGALGILYKPLWQSPEDCELLDTLQPCA